ncbi:Heat shock factor binding 1 [Dillenia turbinata]|uniref:Heat shock factor binding 1 n=1 Tax=Dillenia turbinata TaxID=194707 RepID=A0AAN8W3B8_9MAGN
MDGHDSEDPKQSTADMTVFVQNLLQQMQSRFQAMTDMEISYRFSYQGCLSYPLSDCIASVKVNAMKFVTELDEMGNRINELEQSINDLRAEMGVESSPSPMAPSKQNSEEPKSDGGSA